MPWRFSRLCRPTATTDRIDKLIDYAAVPSLRCFVLPEQTAVAATVLQREPAGVWVASVITGGDLVLPVASLPVPLDDLYQGLRFPS